MKICSKFIGGHPCQSAISIKLPCNVIEITFRHGCYPVNLMHILRTTYYASDNANDWVKRIIIRQCKHQPFQYAIPRQKMNTLGILQATSFHINIYDSKTGLKRCIRNLNSITTQVSQQNIYMRLKLPFIIPPGISEAALQSCF